MHGLPEGHCRQLNRSLLPPGAEQALEVLRIALQVHSKALKQFGSANTPSIQFDITALEVSDSRVGVEIERGRQRLCGLWRGRERCSTHALAWLLCPLQALAKDETADDIVRKLALLLVSHLVYNVAQQVRVVEASMEGQGAARGSTGSAVVFSVLPKS